MKRPKVSDRIRQRELFSGIFKEEPPEESLLLPYERKRLLTLILCLRRLWPIFTDAGVKEVILDVVHDTPSRGLDPVATFAWLFTGKVPRITITFTNQPEFDESWMYSELAFTMPWLYGIAGSSVLHRVLGTAKWYPNDWDIYCMGTCVRPFFADFIELLFRDVREDGSKQANSALGEMEDVVCWWRVGVGNGIRLNLVMSRPLSTLTTFDIDACACFANVPFSAVEVPRTLKDRAATMKTRGVMTLAQDRRRQKYAARLSRSEIDFKIFLIDEIFDFGYGDDFRPFENVF